MSDFKKYMRIYLSEQDKNLKSSTIENKRKYIKFFFNYLQKEKNLTLLDVKKNDVYTFISSKEWSSQTISAAKFVLRDFFNIMKKNSLSNFDGKELYPIIITNKREKILSHYSLEEIKKTIDNIDLNTPCGVRNKCMLTIAAQTGLRASDIIFLKFSEVKWDKNLIYKIQIKTGYPAEIPITPEIKFLMLDYLKNHRPSISSNYIFINNITKKPFINAKNLTTIAGNAYKKANIAIANKKIGAHSFRHSLATNMLKANTPLPIISGVLGHSTMNTTQKYISLDIEGLRLLCLEVPSYDK